MDPVTVRAAPQNVIFIKQLGCGKVCEKSKTSVLTGARGRNRALLNLLLCEVVELLVAEERMRAVTKATKPFRWIRRFSSR